MKVIKLKIIFFKISNFLEDRTAEERLMKRFL